VLGRDDKQNHRFAKLPKCTTAQV